MRSRILLSRRLSDWRSTRSSSRSTRGGSPWSWMMCSLWLAATRMCLRRCAWSLRVSPSPRRKAPRRNGRRLSLTPPILRALKASLHSPMALSVSSLFPQAQVVPTLPTADQESEYAMASLSVMMELSQCVSPYPSMRLNARIRHLHLNRLLIPVNCTCQVQIQS